MEWAFAIATLWLGLAIVATVIANRLHVSIIGVAVSIFVAQITYWPRLLICPENEEETTRGVAETPSPISGGLGREAIHEM